MCYQHSHFIDEKTEARGINEVTSKWKRCFLVSVVIDNKICGNGHGLYRWWAKEILITILFKKKLSMLLSSTQQCPGWFTCSAPFT